MHHRGRRATVGMGRPIAGSPAHRQHCLPSSSQHSHSSVSASNAFPLSGCSDPRTQVLIISYETFRLHAERLNGAWIHRGSMYGSMFGSGFRLASAGSVFMLTEPSAFCLSPLTFFFPTLSLSPLSPPFPPSTGRLRPAALR